jgi:hypothetical protein
MMKRKVSPEIYISQKNDILDNCLNITEKIYACLKNQEDPASLLEKRMAVINDLAALESSVDDKVRNGCSMTVTGQIDDKLRLILNLDKQLEQSIIDTQRNILESLKQNMQGQKFTLFETGDVSENGRFLDEKQ